MMFTLENEAPFYVFYFVYGQTFYWAHIMGADHKQYKFFLHNVYSFCYIQSFFL